MRLLSANMQAAIAAGTVQPIILWEGEFASGPLRLWTGYGQLQWDGKTWTGAGDLGSISPVTETTAVRAETFVSTLSGVNPALLAAAIAECRPYYGIKVWLGLLDDNFQLLASPDLLYVARQDVPAVQDNGDTSTIQLSAENHLFDLQRSADRRLTHEDQQLDHPGDMGLEYVAFIQNQKVPWGQQVDQPQGFKTPWDYILWMAKN